MDEALTEEEKVEQRLGKPIYDLMKCYDGATRAVPIINGVKVDPSLPKESELSKKKDGEKKTKPKTSIQDRIQNQGEDYEIDKHDFEVWLDSINESGDPKRDKEYYDKAMSEQMDSEAEEMKQAEYPEWQISTPNYTMTISNN